MGGVLVGIEGGAVDFDCEDTSKSRNVHGFQVGAAVGKVAAALEGGLHEAAAVVDANGIDGEGPVIIDGLSGPGGESDADAGVEVGAWPEAGRGLSEESPFGGGVDFDEAQAGTEGLADGAEVGGVGDDDALRSGGTRGPGVREAGHLDGAGLRRPVTRGDDQQEEDKQRREKTVGVVGAVAGYPTCVVSARFTHWFMLYIDWFLPLQEYCA